MNAEELAKVKSALETGTDLAAAHAEHTHQAYAGYYPDRHASVDRDVVDMREALAIVERALPAPAASEAPSLTATHGPLHLTNRKTANIVERGYNIVGYVLRRADGAEVCLSAESAVRWLPQAHYWRLVHEQDGSLFQLPQAGAGADDAPQAAELPASTTFSYAANPLEHMEALGCRLAYYVKNPLGEYTFAEPQPTLLKPEYRNLYGPLALRQPQAAELEMVLRCFNTRDWTPEMDRAWHLAIPDVSKAFADLLVAAKQAGKEG